MTELANAVVCGRCGRAVPVVPAGCDLPDNGLVVRLSGYYGGFFDPHDPVRIVLCHDCSLWLWQSIPGLRDERGLHPDNDGPCCDYWWGIDGDTVVYGDGTTRIL